MKQPLVSIIIVNYNGSEFLNKCLSSLIDITYSNYEIIVVDNNSTDNSIDLVKNNFSYVIIKKLDQNYGFTKSNNIGANIAKGEFLFFLNNDTVVTSNFLHKLIDFIQNDSSIGACQCLLKNPDGQIDSCGDFINKDGIPYSSKTISQKPTEILSARGAGFLISKNLFMSLNGFDEKFFISFEDVDLGIRVWLYGYQIYVVPESIIYHTGHMTISKNRKRAQFHGIKNLTVIYLTYFEISFLLKFFKNLISLVICKKSVKSSNFTIPSFSIFIKSFWWVIKNWKYIKTKKSIINKNKKIDIHHLITKKLIFR